MVNYVGPVSEKQLRETLREKLREELAPVREETVKVLDSVSIDPNGVKEFTVESAGRHSALIVTVKASYDPNATAGVRVRYLYSPCLLYTSPSPRDRQKSRMPSSA